MRSLHVTRSSLLLLFGVLISSRVDGVTQAASFISSSGPPSSEFFTMVGSATFEAETASSGLNSYPIETLTIAVETSLGSAHWTEDEIIGGFQGHGQATVTLDDVGGAALDIWATDAETGSVFRAEWLACQGCVGGPPDEWVIFDPVFFVVGGVSGERGVGGPVFGRATGPIVPEPGAGIMFALGAWLIAARRPTVGPSRKLTSRQ